MGGWANFFTRDSIPTVRSFGDGRWLVVASRTRDKANARVLTSDGALLDRLMLGDGIEHITIDRDHRIWVGWFDEGMFGNDTGQVLAGDRQ